MEIDSINSIFRRIHENLVVDIAMHIYITNKKNVIISFASQTFYLRKGVFGSGSGLQVFTGLQPWLKMLKKLVDYKIRNARLLQTLLQPTEQADLQIRHYINYIAL